MEKYYITKLQRLEMKPIEASGFILDIGGGGEGIIGRLNGRQVVAIDIKEEELKETETEALKIVMDARDLKFLPGSFEVCTAFFSFMYIPKEDHLKVFREVYRILKEGGRFLIWDVTIPEPLGDYEVFVVHLKVRLPGGEVATGYGVRWDKTQDLSHFKALAAEVGFEPVREWVKGEIFHLELVKG